MEMETSEYKDGGNFMVLAKKKKEIYKNPRWSFFSTTSKII